MLQVLRSTLPGLLADFQPELVMYNAGVDVHREDSLGKLALSNEGIYLRDRYVLEQCAGAAVPVACAIGGGYEPNHQHIVDRHMCLHRAASELMPEILASREAVRAGRRAATGAVGGGQQA
jgi:acetoin utilization deacetylase AcuC-like enzyme